MEVKSGLRVKQVCRRLVLTMSMSMCASAQLAAAAIHILAGAVAHLGQHTAAVQIVERFR
jgi:hypothetical protein